MSSLSNVWFRALRSGAKPLRRIYWASRAIALGRAQSWRHVGGKFYMRIDPADFMDRSFYFGTYEQHLVRLIAAMVRPGDVCVDVGAHKGFIALHLAAAVGERGKVIAFEPDPRAMQALASNVHRNGFHQVRLFACALGDRDGVCQFVLSRQLGWSSRFPNDLAKAAVGSMTSVSTKRLDEVLGQEGISPETHELPFIKIDAEGSEPLILQGARQTLAEFRPAIHIEVNKASLSAGGFTTDSIEALLRSLDYELYAIRFLRTGPLLRRRLSFIPIGSLRTDIQGCQDVLAVSSPSPALERVTCLPELRL